MKIRSVGDEFFFMGTER